MCVIIGVSIKTEKRSKHLNYGDFSRTVSNINAYLIEGEDLYVQSEPRPISKSLPRMATGSVPNDGGYLILDQDEVRELIKERSSTRHFLHPFFGSQDYLQGHTRTCLVIDDDEVADARAISSINERLNGVSKLRLLSKKSETRELLAHTPHRFQHRGEIPAKSALIIPSVSSERREWFPAGIVSGGSVVSNLAFMIVDQPLYNLALLTSRLHLSWVATVCGKLKNDYRYSNTLGWHTFPVPVLTEKNRLDLTRCAEDILLAREAHFPATIADLYDPEGMPADLREAHERNDEVLERIYIGRRFRNDTERLEKLFELYTKVISPKRAA